MRASIASRLTPPSEKEPGRPAKAHELRAIASPRMPRPSTLVGVAFVLGDFLVFYGGAAAATVAPWWFVKAIGVAASGFAAAMLFTLGHDAAHGTLLTSRRANRLVGTICFLPSWYLFTPWIRAHNHLHHGWTNVAECDDSWRPVSPSDYLAMPRWRRALERVYRSWWGLWTHSIVEIWWKHMAMPRDTDRRFLNARDLAVDRLVVAAYVVAHVVLCWLVAPWSTIAGGPELTPAVLVAAVVVIPWWIFHVMFAVVTFLHHTHPRIPWVRTKRESSFFAGQVQATVHVELPVWIERLLHNTMVHNAHHVDARIPFQELPEAQRRLESRFTGEIIVERWSLRSFLEVTRVCQLYDYDTREWRTFQAAADSLAIGAEAPHTGTFRVGVE